MVVSSNAGGCPTVGLTGLSYVADTALYAYYHPLPLGIASVHKNVPLQLYPNPASQEINFTSDKQVPQVSMINSIGQITMLPYH